MAAVLATLALAPALARAGTWTLVSCTQPDGQPAPTDGWSTTTYNATANAPDSGDSDTCAQGGSLIAVSSTSGTPPIYTGPEWLFTAPAGTTIAGGTITATLTSPQGQTWIGTPQVTYDSADVIVNCQLNEPCGSNGTYSGTFPITHPGGTAIYAPALCVNLAPGSTTCPATGQGVNAEIDIHAAEIELNALAVPTGTDFTGPLLDPRARGVADLLLTAADPDGGGGHGPGVYSVTVQIDGATLYSGTPNTNGGACVPVGTDASDGALMFDHAQPCAAIEAVDIPIDTRGLPDGSHDLKVTVTDAAGNASVVLDRTISTSNPKLTPLPSKRGEVHARLVVGWRWTASLTRLVSVSTRRLPAHGRIAVRCLGRRCPRLRLARVSTRHARALWGELIRAKFKPGNRLRITISAPHRLSERIEFVIRPGRLPLARLL
jgi:hypothetical protein